ncbi:hypothetical protein cypCar_00024617, partial [Cyprinus carpio]
PTHAVECVSLLNDVRQSKLIGLVQQNNEHALFIYSHRRMAITGDDVTLDEIIPISYDFSVVEVSSPDELAVVGADTQVRVTFFKEELELKLPFGSHTRLFLSEVNRAWSDVCEQYPKDKPKFEWLTKYRKMSKGARTERVKSEVRDDLIRNSQPILSNKSQMLGMPQFGLRDNLIKCELLKNEDAYTYIENYSFFLGTYNVNGQNPKESLSPWLASTTTPPDFYLVAFQELDLSKEAFLFNDTPKEPEWMLAVYKGLHPDAKYAFVKLVRLVGIMLLFYVKVEHAAHISEVEVESVGTGVMGRLLKRQMDEEVVFVGFTEGEIDFQPTYKYDTGSDQWDTSEKCRVPAWCDRILWKGKNIKQLHYQSHMTLKTSDHKPVSSLLEIGIKVVNEESYKRTFEEIVRDIDRLENDCIPSVTLSQREFQFQDVKFMQHQAKTVTVYNDGQVPCQFEFIPKLDEPSYCKPWLTANPAKGFLAQGASVDIDLEVFVNRTTAPELNSGQQQLEDILVLHLDRGKDYFIFVTGNYLPSCFGSSLSTLCLLKEPIQDMPLETIRELSMKSTSQGSNPETDKPQEIPKEIWMMVDHLYRNAKKQEELFQQPGLRSEFEEIRDCLDTGSLDSLRILSHALLAGSNHSVSEALLLFLDALPEPVIPFSFYPQCLECCSDSSQCRQIISMLPQCHKNVFNYLTAFLQELLKFSAHNRLDVNILAPIFAGLLLRSPTKQDSTEKRKVKEFFQHFLVQTPSDRDIHYKSPE